MSKFVNNKRVICIIAAFMFITSLIWGLNWFIGANTKFVEVNTMTSIDDLAKGLEDNTLNSKQLIIITSNSNFKSYGARKISEYENIYVASYKTRLGAKYAYSQLKKDTNIAYVEINTALELSTAKDTLNKKNIENKEETEATELDKYLSSLKATKEIKVAILDTGLNTNKFNGKYIDIETDYSGETNTSLSDTNGHGTEIANLVAENNNSLINIVPIKIADKNGDASIISTYLGIKKAIENKVDIINISMTTLESKESLIITSAIEDAISKGIKVVVSAGNSSEDASNISPANIENTIAVSAVADNNEIAAYSNYGNTVEYSAYGSYNGKHGTSYSAARVTGIIADLLSKEKEISELDKYVIDLGESGYDNYFGKGLLSKNFKVTGLDQSSLTGTTQTKNNLHIQSITSSDILQYGVDRFPVEYSNGYIQNTVPSEVGTNVASTTWSNGVNFYTGTNTVKDVDTYIKYKNAAVVVDSSGNLKALDLKIYFWSGTGQWYAHTTHPGVRGAGNITTMEFHFYESGTNTECSFKGVLKFNDLDVGEGVLLYEGYNNIYTTKASSWLTYVPVGGSNSSDNSPFKHSGGAAYPYFFSETGGNGDNNQALWVELNSTPTTPFQCEYGSLSSGLDIDAFYTGTPINYYLDGVKTKTLYCASYGTHTLTNPASLGSKTGYSYNNNWYTNSSYTGTSYTKGSIINIDATEISLYTYSSPNTYKLTLNANGGTFKNPDGSSTLTTWSKNFTYTQSTCFAHMLTYQGDTNLNAVAEPTRTGYTFAGWTLTSGGGSVTENSSGYWYFDGNYAGNVTISAQWTPNKYTLTINPNGGSMYNGDTYTSNTFTTEFTYNRKTYIGNLKSDGNYYLYNKPSKNGYTFTGFNFSGGTGGKNTSGSTYYFSNNATGSSTEVYIFNGDYAGNVTATAQYTANIYKITLDTNGGTLAQSGTSAGSGNVIYEKYNTDWGYSYNSTALSPTINWYGSSRAYVGKTATRTGYTFKGFYTSTSGGTQIINSSGTMVVGPTYFTSDTTLYAQWEPSVYTISLDNQYATTAGTAAYYEKYNTGNYTTSACTTSISKITVPTKTGYTFGGYYTGTNGGGVSYIDSSGNISATSTAFTSNATLYAKWTINSSTLVIKPNNGKWNDSASDQTFTQNYNTVKNIPIPIRDGYTFTGWARTNTYGTMSSLTSAATYTFGATNNVTDTLTAQWSPKQYTLTINPNGGSMYGNINGTLGWFSNSQTRLFTYNTPLKFASTAGYANSTNGQFYLDNILDGSLYKPLRTGYTFNGWKISSSGGLATVSYVDNGDGTKKEEYTYPSTYAGNDTVTAQWQINQSTLTVYPNGGSWSSYGYVYSKSFTQNYNTTLAIPDPTKPNYTATFNANGGNCSTTSTKTNVAFSSWNIDSIGTAGTLSNKVFTFGPTRGGSGSITAQWSGSYNITLPTPTRTGYTFNGWYTASSGGTKVGNAGATVTLSSDIAYYAQWTPNKYNLTINPNGGWMHTPSGELTKSSYTKKFTFDDRVCYISTGTVGFYNDTYLAVSLPDRDGYTFKGWKITTGGGTVGQELFSPWWDYDASYAGDVTVTAQWEANKYNLTINPNGGMFLFAPVNESGSDKYNYRQTTSYTRKFIYGKETSFSSLSNSTIIYYSEDLSDIYNKNIYGAVSRPIRRGYTLNGWNKPVNSSNSNVTSNSYGETIQNAVKTGSSTFLYTADYAGDTTISANWLANSYTIKYSKGATDCSDSLTPSTQSATYDKDVTLQTKGSLVGRSYAITLDSNIPSTASTANTYKITASKISGNLSFNNWEIQKENDTEAGWGSDSHGPYGYIKYNYDLKNYTSGQTVTKANFTSVPDGQVTATARYDSKTITPYTPSMTGYIFKGWYTDKNCTDGNKVTSITVDENTSAYKTTLYAKWEPITYKIVYHGNNHWNTSQGDYTQTLTFDKEETLTACKFTRDAANPGYTHRFGKLEEGYDFAGWAKTQGSTAILTQTAIGTGKSITYTDQVKAIFNLTSTNGATIDLYAIWMKDLSLTFNLNGGLYDGKDTIDPLEVYIWNSTYEHTFDIAKYYGEVINNGLNSKLQKIDSNGNVYRFLGWSLDRTATVPDNDFIVYDNNKVTNYSIQDDKTLYAVWENILKVNYEVGRTNGTITPTAGNVYPSLNNITATTINPVASTVIKPGEQGYYDIKIFGNANTATTVFDEKVTNIYTLAELETRSDTLNPINNEATTFNSSAKCGLNRQLELSGIINRKFYVPVYYADVYQGENYLTFKHTISQDSYYYKYYVDGKDKEEITINVIVYLSGKTSTGTSSDDIVSTLDELKALIKTKVVQ